MTDEINQIRRELGLTVKQLGKLLDINDESTMRQYVAAPTANRYRKPAARMVRLLRAYEAGYRPDDWPLAPDGTEAFMRELQATFWDEIGGERMCLSLYSAMTNIEWKHPYHGKMHLSFRQAAETIARLIGEGDYNDWYCSAPAGVVSDYIEQVMSVRGWTWQPATKG